MEQFISDNPMDGSDDETIEGYPENEMKVFLLVSHFIILFIGLPGNCLIIRVYWTKTPKTSTHVFIMSLAFADFSVCLLRIADIVEVLVSVKMPWFLQVLESVSIASSVMITAAIAADRYDCICRPRKRFFTTKRSKVTALGILMSSVLINIPNVINGFNDFEYEVVDIISLAILFACFVAAFGMIALCYTKVYLTIRQHVRVNVASSVRTNGLRPTDNGPESCPNPDVSDMSLIDMGNSSVINPISVCTTAQTNTSRIANTDHNDSSSPYQANRAPPKHPGQTNQEVSAQESERAPQEETGEDQKVWTINRHARARKGRVPNAGSAGLQRKTTNMLFITSLVFLFTWIPNWINVCFLFVEEGGINPLFAKTWDALNSIPYYINNAINPVIYGLLNRRFRKDCNEVLRKMKVFGCGRGGRQ